MTGFVGLECSTINIIANRTAEAKNTKNEDAFPTLSSPIPANTLKKRPTDALEVKA